MALAVALPMGPGVVRLWSGTGVPSMRGPP